MQGRRANKPVTDHDTGEVVTEGHRNGEGRRADKPSKGPPLGRRTAEGARPGEGRAADEPVTCHTTAPKLKQRVERPNSWIKRPSKKQS